MSRMKFGPISLALAVGVALPAASQAQETPPVTPVPQKHVVQLGETLWGIARLYLGDPLLWPEIYRINTAVVEDPHWIFPGEELFLAPVDRTQVAVAEPAPAAPAAPVAPTPVTPTPPPTEQQAAEARPLPPGGVPDLPPDQAAAPPPPPQETGPTVFRRRGPARIEQTRLEGPGETYRALRAGDFYKSGFLTEKEALPWAHVLGNADPTAHRMMTRRTAVIQEVVQIQPPPGANYQVGDSLVTYRLAREIPGGWGDVAHPTGIVRVLHVAGRDVFAEVLTQFDRVAAEQVALPAEAFPDPGMARPAPVADGVRGGLIALKTTREVPQQYDVVFIDLGRNAGVRPGDIFELLRRPDELATETAPQDAVAELQVVHVRARSATAILTQLNTVAIRNAARRTEGAPVRLIRKMPS